MHYYTHEKMANFRNEQVARSAERRRQWNLKPAQESPLQTWMKEHVAALVRLFQRSSPAPVAPAVPVKRVTLDSIWTSTATSPLDELDLLDEAAPVG